MSASYLEITTSIGCTVNCRKYCPQEKYRELLGHILPLTLDKFKKLIDTLPESVGIIFAGLSEPFLNQQCTDMILYAHKKGHKIIIFSTLVGLKKQDAERIKDIPFERFVIHLPDAEGNAHIPVTTEYLETLGIIIQNIHNREFMDMGNKFVTDKHENIIRGNPPPPKKGRLHCYKYEAPDYIMLPNGDVFYCCQMKGLTGKVGSLYENTYAELTSKYDKITKNLQTDPDSYCRLCGVSYSLWKYKLMKLASKLFPTCDWIALNKIIFGKK
jgi:hypothetical protein